MTRKILLFLSASLLSAFTAFAADEPPFMPMSPQIMGQGGAETATAHGYDSFFTNPAGFSRSPGNMTVTSLGAWMYASPQGLLDVPPRLFGGLPAGDQVGAEITSGGFGGGASLGVGYAGNGLGLGMFLLFDSFLAGPTLAEAAGDVTATVAFIGGLSVPLNILGLTVHAGGDVRPMLRIHSPLAAGAGPALVSAFATQGDLLAALASSGALYGLGIALDLGFIAEIKGFSFGVSFRDVGGTTFNYALSTVGAVQSSLETALRFPGGSAPPEAYTIPMEVSAGMALHPDLGSLSTLVDPVVHLEVQDIGTLLLGQRAPWTFIHAGLQADIASVFSLRVGLSQGYFTAGAGVHLVFFDLNGAFFTREMGQQQWEKPSSGAALELAFRF